MAGRLKYTGFETRTNLANFVGNLTKEIFPLIINILSELKSLE